LRNGTEYDKDENIKEMKHSLIILSILLLSSPIIGEETGVLYQSKKGSNVQ